MESKRIIYIGMFLGGMLGGYIPTVFGTQYFSMWSIFGNAIGALFGIYIAFKLSR
jgi:hypothetical protein